VLKRLLFVTAPAVIAAMCLAAISFEVWVRIGWDASRGTPGLFVSDPVRGETLAPDYSGWFAGVPVRFNRLGFRDTREYALAKPPAGFRILVLGDSVTFGHGSVYEHTWPYLLEQQLKSWRPDVAWQVWNLGVPGYNTSQELAYLLDVGPRFKPDLVIVGFFGNDVIDNGPVGTATRRAIWIGALKTSVRRHIYSLDWYKKQYALARYRLFASASERTLLEGLATQEQLLARPGLVADLDAQRLTDPRPMTDGELAREQCTAPSHGFSSAELEKTPGFGAWKEAVGRLQRLHRDGIYRIVFFINAAPAGCFDEDVFDPRGTKPLDDYLLSVLSRDTPAVSSHDAFIRFHPSDMPRANGHSLGNANAVKASVLFRFLRDRVLTPLPPRNS
jgi:hypothetical protein